MNIRIANLEDINRISCVLAASWKTAYRGIVNDDYLDSLKNDHWVEFLTSGLGNSKVSSMIIENSQEIIGAAIMGKTEKDGEVCLISFYLLPDRIGQGFGHTFYTKLENELINQGFTNCVLDVLENNNIAINFYKAHGFVDTNTETTAVLGKQSYVCKILEKRIS